MYVGVVFNDVAREFHWEKYMHFCMHKSIEPLYRVQSPKNYLYLQPKSLPVFTNRSTELLRGERRSVSTLSGAEGKRFQGCSAWPLHCLAVVVGFRINCDISAAQVLPVQGRRRMPALPGDALHGAFAHPICRPTGASPTEAAV